MKTLNSRRLPAIISARISCELETSSRGLRAEAIPLPASCQLCGHRTLSG